MDELLLRLRSAGIGCHIGTTFAGALAYADDVSLIAPTRNSLLQMLRVVNSFSRDYDVNFNASKSKLLLFSSSKTILYQNRSLSVVQLSRVWRTIFIWETLLVWEWVVTW